jgi:hypothetical protein
MVLGSWFLVLGFEFGGLFISPFSITYSTFKTCTAFSNFGVIIFYIKTYKLERLQTVIVNPKAHQVSTKLTKLLLHNSTLPIINF